MAYSVFNSIHFVIWCLRCFVRYALEFGLWAACTNREPNIFRWPSYPVFVIIIHVVIARVFCIYICRYISQSSSTHTHTQTHAHAGRKHIDFAAKTILFLFSVSSTKHTRTNNILNKLLINPERLNKKKSRTHDRTKSTENKDCDECERIEREAQQGGNEMEILLENRFTAQRMVKKKT